MATLDQIVDEGIVKLLLIGDSGTAKTGSLASLAIAGYRLVIEDYDNGLDSLAQVLRKQKPEALKNVHYQTLTDKLKSVNGEIVPNGTPTAFSRGMALLDNWPGLGAASTWDSNTILVIDSLTFCSSAAMRFVMALNGRFSKPQIQDWGAAMEKIEGLLGILYSDNIKCHVIINSHISYVEGEDGASRGYPSTLGQKLPPKVGRYFNAILQTKIMGSGPTAKRFIRTVPDSMIPLKSPVPDLPAELPIETGLADYFKKVAKPLQLAPATQPANKA